MPTDLLIWVAIVMTIVGYCLGIYVGRHYNEFTKEQENNYGKDKLQGEGRNYRLSC